MTLKQVILQTSTPKTLDLDNVDPANTLILKSLSGLSSTDVTLFTGDFARDGGYYQGRRAGKLNPVFNFKINPDYTNNVSANQIRESLYRMFHEPDDTDGLVVTLKDDVMADRYFVGYTEKIEADMFAKEMAAQVSMLAVDPYIRSSSETVVTDTGLVSTTIAYSGTADTGIELYLKINTATSTVNVSLAGQSLLLTKPSGSYAVNDVIYINTNTGSRAIKLNGVDIMAHLSSTSKFVNLRRASNAFSTYGASAGDGKVVLTQYKYRAAWWGI